MKCIYIIEDDDNIRENLITLLELENFKTFSSNEGKKAIAEIKTIIPDLILCDIMLPDIDGYQIFREIKKFEKTKFVPFIFLTAKAEMKDLRTGMNLGADDYLTKPFDSKELIHVLKTRLQSKYTFLNGHEEKPENLGKITMEDYLFVQSTKEVKKIQVKKIVCISASGEYSDIFTEDGEKIFVRKLMKNWEMILPENNFIRIHKSIIINLLFAVKVEKWFNNSFRIHLHKYPEPLISSRRFSRNLRDRFLK